MLSLSCLIGAVVQNLCSKLGILSLSERAAAQAELMSLADLTTPYALRAAVGLGLPMLVKDGTTTIEELADCSGAPVRAVGRLVAYLTLKGVFIRPTADIVALTAVGDLLTTEQARIMLDPREIGSHLSLALSGLPHGARTGAAGYDAVAGRSFWQTLEQDRALAASFDRYMAGRAAQWIATDVGLSTRALEGSRAGGASWLIRLSKWTLCS